MFKLTNTFNGKYTLLNADNDETFKKFINKQKREIIRIYTDGSCLGNNTKNKKRKAGIGVYWGKNDPRNISEPLPEEYKRTNNVPELVAIRRALDGIENEDCKDCDYHIYSDSNYSINSITKWIYQWKRNNWKTNNGKIKNLELIKDIYFKYIELSKKYVIRFYYVKAHTNNDDINSLGNKEADKLAKAGASRS